MVERRIKAARFPVVKSLDSFDFKVIPSLNKALVLELARCAYIERRENLIALGNSGTGKTHIALGLGLAACQKGLSVGFITAAALVMIYDVRLNLAIAFDTRYDLCGREDDRRAAIELYKSALREEHPVLGGDHTRRLRKRLGELSQGQ